MEASVFLVMINYYYSWIFSSQRRLIEKLKIYS